MSEGGRGQRPGATKGGATPQLDEPAYVPRAVDIGAQLRARIHRKADAGHAAPKPDGIEHVPQKGDGDHKYQHDMMHPGPLTNQADPKKSLAHGYYGGKYDEHALKDDKLFYRVCTEIESNDPTQLGRWFTEEPLESDMQLQIDAAVKPAWRDNQGKVTGLSPAQMCITVLVPKGTKVYPGPVAPQGDAMVGGMGKKQVCIPEIRTCGAVIKAKAPFKRDGHKQPAPQQGAGAGQGAAPPAGGDHHKATSWTNLESRSSWVSSNPRRLKWVRSSPRRRRWPAQAIGRALREISANTAPPALRRSNSKTSHVPFRARGASAWAASATST